MGNTQLTDQQILLYKNETQFTPAQIRRIHKKFQQLDTNNKGFVSATDFIKIIQHHKYSPLLIQQLIGRKQQEIDFIQLVRLLNAIQFGDKNTLLTRIMDQDRDGLIGTEDIQKTITVLNPSCFKNSYELAQQVVNDNEKLTYNKMIKLLIDD
ncbi:unnamed protein product [Paramecium primaurelia]|uniref:EF-hand domain-containing protein n=2 Tax=Paramecium TaxID=5884 RepID=A0A8S1SJR7_9CILI|nr:unnamed protein product [Paramecium primaurelia]CAD8139597.1 unnamed protein product [Paramecium pentaurelia]